MRGLTTASSIWITASIGIVAGLGMFWLSLTATILTWITLTVVKTIEIRTEPQPDNGGPTATTAPTDDLD